MAAARSSTWTTRRLNPRPHDRGGTVHEFERRHVLTRELEHGQTVPPPDVGAAEFFVSERAVEGGAGG
jgi:hypothetical protein